MKTLKTLLAVSVMAGAVSAQAATFNVTGQQTNVTVTGAIATPTLTFTPDSTPDFSGVWNIDTAVPSLSAVFNFEAFNTNVSVFGGAITGDISAPNNIYTNSGGTLAYNAGTRTLTLTNATAPFSGTANTCTGNAAVCSSQPSAAEEDLDITLTFAADFLSFTGTAYATNDGTSVGGGLSVQTWQFEGVADAPAVPLPAAAWLFGSGLLGLAGTARRRRNAA